MNGVQAWERNVVGIAESLRRFAQEFERLGRARGLGRALPGDPYESEGVLPPKWLTWGQQQTLPFVLPGAGEGTVPFYQATQLVRVDYHMPTSWYCKVVFDFSGLNGQSFPPGTEIDVSYTLTVGVGQANITEVHNFTATADADGNFAQIVDNQQFPAQGIQLTAQLQQFISVAGVPATNANIIVTAMVAPVVF